MAAAERSDNARGAGPPARTATVRGCPVCGPWGVWTMTTDVTSPVKLIHGDQSVASIRPDLASILACPSCSGTVTVTATEVRCCICDGRWSRGRRGVPLFDDDHLSCQAESAQAYQLSPGGGRGLLRRLSTPPTLGLDLATSRCLRRLGCELRQARSVRPVLNVGSGAALTDSMRRLGEDVLSRTIHLDVSCRFDLVDLVADAGGPWPVRTGSLDAVVASALLPYLARPDVFADQVSRVLAPGGWLFVTAPMLQPQMEDFDCTRWTTSGLRRLFGDFEVIDSGATAGPATVFGRTLMELLSIVSSVPHRKLWGPARSFWGWLLWPIKYFDLVLMSHPRSHVLASAVYLLARKPY